MSGPSVPTLTQCHDTLWPVLAPHNVQSCVSTLHNVRPQRPNTYTMSWHIVACVNTTQCPDLCSNIYTMSGHTVTRVNTTQHPDLCPNITMSGHIVVCPNIAQCPDPCPNIMQCQATLWSVLTPHNVRTYCDSVQDTLWQCPGHLVTVSVIRDSCVYSFLNPIFHRATPESCLLQLPHYGLSYVPKCLNIASLTIIGVCIQWSWSPALIMVITRTKCYDLEWVEGQIFMLNVIQIQELFSNIGKSEFYNWEIDLKNPSLPI